MTGTHGSKDDKSFLQGLGRCRYRDRPTIVRPQEGRDQKHMRDLERDLSTDRRSRGWDVGNFRSGDQDERIDLL
jgi:hypothetical protein